MTSDIQRWNNFQEATSDGAWVRHSDHASRVRELEEAVRVLAKEMARTQKYVLNLRNGYDDLNRSIGKVSCAHPSDALTALIKSWDDFANNPIASNAVKEAGNG